MAQAGGTTGEQAAVRTFLIADVRGYTRYTLEHGDAAAARLATRFAGLTEEVVSAREGAVIELRGDEALAVFTSTRQALWAAIELQARFVRAMADDQSLPLKVGIGLDAGEAIPVGGGYRGAALNLAARLSSLAGPGEVLASDGVIHLARKLDGLTYVDRGSAPLKGFTDPVTLYGVVAAGENTLTEPAEAAALASRQRIEPALPIGGFLGALPPNALVGRETELAAALRAVDLGAAGTGKLLLLVGEPGAGKTRLAQEVTLQLRDREFLIAAGRCYEPQATVPFYPFVEALTALYAAAPRSIQVEVPRQWPDLARLLPALGLPVPETASQDEQRLFWAVTGFLQAIAARSAVALLLDDLHWADPASIELLQHLARHSGGQPILLLATYRDVEVNRQHPLEGALRDLQRESLIERVDIRRLPREETGALIAAVMGEDEVSGEFTALVYDRTEGNPFFVQQVLRVLVERGDVYRQDGRWDRRAIAEIEVPESVRSVVGQRLSRLAETTQETLREASVLGQTLTFDELLAISGKEEGDLEQRLDEAVKVGLLQTSDGETYRFDHALTQSVLYLELSPRRRRRLHLSAGEAIEALPDRKRKGRTAELAWHFLQASDAERALPYVLLAAVEAETLVALGDAAFQYRTAIELAQELEDQAREADAREKLGAVLLSQGRPAEALAEYEAAAEGYRELDDPQGELRAMAGIGWTLFELGRRDEGIERLTPHVSRWQETATPSPAAASLHIALANLYWHGGRHAEGLPVIDRAIEIAEAVGDDRLIGLAEGRRALLLIDNPAGQLAAYNRSIALAEATGDLQTLARSLNNRAIWYDEENRPDLAILDAERHLAIARRLGNPTHIAWALSHLNWEARDDRRRAMTYTDEILALGPRIRGTRASAMIATAVWQKVLAGDVPPEALAQLAVEAEASGDEQLRDNALAKLVEVELSFGRDVAARDRASRLLALPGISQDQRDNLEVHLARAHLAAGDLAAAESLALAGLEGRQGVAVYFAPAMYTGVLACVRAAQGRRAEANDLLVEGLAFLERTRFYPYVIDLRYRYGLILAAQGDASTAREHLDKALALATRMEFAPQVARIERALAGLA